MNDWDDFGDYWVWLFTDAVAAPFHMRRETSGWVIAGNKQAHYEFSADQIEALGLWLVDQAAAMRQSSSAA